MDNDQHSRPHHTQKQRLAVRQPSPSQARDTDATFRYAYDLCTVYDLSTAVVPIRRRWALPTRAEWNMVTSTDRSRNSYGKGQKRAETRTYLLNLVHPAATESMRQQFKARVKRAHHFYTLVHGLGWGTLVMIPPEDVTDVWLGKSLHVDQLQVFVGLVRREQPDLYFASKVLEVWLGLDAIAGGLNSGKQTLSIEAEAPVAVYDVEEIPDSKDDDLDDEAAFFLVRSIQPLSSHGAMMSQVQ